MTFEPLLPGPTFARCAFTGSSAEPNWTMDGTYIYIYMYMEDFTQQYDKCAAHSCMLTLLTPNWPKGLHFPVYKLLQEGVEEDYEVSTAKF